LAGFVEHIKSALPSDENRRIYPIRSAEPSMPPNEMQILAKILRERVA